MPAVSTRSLCAIGRPCSTPKGPPFAVSSSARAASAIARSATRVTIALTFGLTRSMRARCAAMTSRAETSRRRIMSVSSTALRSQSSSLPPVAAPSTRGIAVAAAIMPTASPKPRRVIETGALCCSPGSSFKCASPVKVFAGFPVGQSRSLRPPHRFMMNSRSTVLPTGNPYSPTCLNP